MHMYVHINMAVICRMYLQIHIFRFFKLKNLLHDEYTIFPFLMMFFVPLVTVFSPFLVFPETGYISAQHPHLGTVFRFDFCYTKQPCGQAGEDPQEGHKYDQRTGKCAM